VAKKPAKKESETDKKIRLLVNRIKRLEKQVQELEREITRRDLDEITEVKEKLNAPIAK
jgi:predicted RNase H-like nuclease (RuvC/YqgF family)